MPELMAPSIPSGWGVDELPFARRRPHGLFCPFCGQQRAKLSIWDISGDPVRLELYCESEACEAREMAVVLLRGDRPQHRERADVAALLAVDRGTDAERSAVGHGSSAETAVRAALDLRNRLARRQRPSRISVHPLEPGAEIKVDPDGSGAAGSSAPGR